MSAAAKPTAPIPLTPRRETNYAGAQLLEAAFQHTHLHRRAARWIANQGLTRETAGHALAAQDDRLAADPLVSSAMDTARSGHAAATARGRRHATRRNTLRSQRPRGLRGLGQRLHACRCGNRATDPLIVLYRIAARLNFQHGRRDTGHVILAQRHDIGARCVIRRLSAAAWPKRTSASLSTLPLSGAGSHVIASVTMRCLCGSAR